MKFTFRTVGPAALVVLCSVVALLVASGATAKSAPENTKAPVIASQTLITVGSTLQGDRGSWSGKEPISYKYQWARCDDNGKGCKKIDGASDTSYKVVQDDVGHTIVFQVTAKNADGKATANSKPTSIVQSQGGGGGGGGGNNPGSNVVDVKDVGPAGDRLVVDKVVFNPSTVTSRSVPIHVAITVKNTKGKLVKGALVFLRSTPVVASIPTDAPTGSDGTVSYNIQPQSDFPIRNGYSVQFFVKAYRQGDPTLAGIAGTRLVQVATHKP